MLLLSRAPAEYRAQHEYPGQGVNHRSGGADGDRGRPDLSHRPTAFLHSQRQPRYQKSAGRRGDDQNRESDQRKQSNARNEPARIEQRVRIEFLFQRAHQLLRLASFAPDIELIFDLVRRAQDDHLAAA